MRFFDFQSAPGADLSCHFRTISINWRHGTNLPSHFARRTGLFVVEVVAHNIDPQLSLAKKRSQRIVVLLLLWCSRSRQWGRPTSLSGSVRT
jgi:hypothetical protein